MKKTIVLAGTIILATLAGCASNAEQQRELEMLADRRAGILASGLPIEFGPLSIMKATAKGATVSIEMIYNQSSELSIEDLFTSSTNYYCTNSDIVETMNKGVNYRIKIRNSRGQIITDDVINSATCNVAEE